METGEAHSGEKDVDAARLSEDAVSENASPEPVAAARGFDIRAVLRLVRLPAVFTALADICLGFLLNHRGWSDGPRDFACLLGASACLYLAGMALNDVFDREQDTRERPFRPIPSGRISLRDAAMLGGVLMLAGIGLAAVVSGQALMIAIGLAGCILLYDGLLKSTVLGPVAMGGCRFLNVMLGASAQMAWIFVWRQESVMLAACLGVYTAGITWFARNEAVEGASRWNLFGGAFVINAGLCGFLLWVRTRAWPENQVAALALLALVTMNLDVRLYRAIRSGATSLVQPTVRLLLLSIIVLDATLVFYKTGDVVAATATIALLLPAVTVGRWVYLT